MLDPRRRKTLQRIKTGITVFFVIGVALRVWLSLRDVLPTLFQ